MRIASWNINGYSARMKDGSLDYLFRQHYDVVCLQETKLSTKSLPNKAADFHMACSCAEGGRHHGVAVFTKEAPLQVITSGTPEIDAEGRIVAVELASVWVLSVYSPTFLNRPDREPYRMKYEHVLRDFVTKLFQSGKPIVLCGDLNVTAEDIDCHHASIYGGTPNHTAAEREAFRSLIALGFVDVWRGQHPTTIQYSWMPMLNTPRGLCRDAGSGFRFDYILASQGLEVVSSDILVSHPGSDHVPVVAEFRL